VQPAGFTLPAVKAHRRGQTAPRARCCSTSCHTRVATFDDGAL